MTGRRWTADEINYLENHIHRNNLDVLAEALGRTEEAVDWKARQLGIIQPVQYRWTDEDVQLLEDLVRATAKYLGIKPKTLAYRINTMLDNGRFDE